MKKYIIPIIIALAVIASFASYHKGYKKGISKAVETIITQIDTVVRVDTITAVKPVYLTQRVVDSIPYYIHVADTISVLAYLPRTERTYKDSSYFVRIAGVEPTLEEISVYQKTNYIHEVTYIPQKDTRKEFVEIDAKFLWDKVPTAPVTLNIGHFYGPFEVYAGGGYDLLQRSPIAQVGTKVQFKF
jgi:hypothetical protein